MKSCMLLLLKATVKRGPSGPINDNSKARWQPSRQSAQRVLVAQLPLRLTEFGDTDSESETCPPRVQVKACCSSLPRNSAASSNGFKMSNYKAMNPPSMHCTSCTRAKAHLYEKISLVVEIGAHDLAFFQIPVSTVAICIRCCICEAYIFMHLHTYFTSCSKAISKVSLADHCSTGSRLEQQLMSQYS